jgi:hypothetical protein
MDGWMDGWMVQGLGLDGGLKFVENGGLQGCSCMVVFSSMLMHSSFSGCHGRKEMAEYQLNPQSNQTNFFIITLVLLANHGPSCE